jgi:hypothetical protein
MSKRDTKHTALEKLVLGLAQQQIVTRGMQYIDRGWLTADEYDDFIKILYQPYADFGGNGMGEKVMNDVMKLPIRGTPPAGAFQLVTEEKRA